MAIMKLSNVPELTEFAGTEKIYVNDNGETKQISCDKVVTSGGGGGRIIFDNPSQGSVDAEILITALEEGKDIWVKFGNSCCKILGLDWASGTGATNFVSGSYLTISGGMSPSSTLKAVLLTTVSSETDMYNRLAAVFSANA